MSKFEQISSLGRAKGTLYLMGVGGGGTGSGPSIDADGQHTSNQGAKLTYSYQMPSTNTQSY